MRPERITAVVLRLDTERRTTERVGMSAEKSVTNSQATSPREFSLNTFKDNNHSNKATCEYDLGRSEIDTRQMISRSEPREPASAGDSMASRMGWCRLFGSNAARQYDTAIPITERHHQSAVRSAGGRPRLYCGLMRSDGARSMAELGKRAGVPKRVAELEWANRREALGNGNRDCMGQDAYMHP
jgi:hypothetical protein